jgi:ABC-2 type transport system permease protein
LVRAEALKLRTTRTFWALTLGTLAFVAVSVTAMSAASHFSSRDHPVQEALAPVGPVQTLALLLGVLAVTSEFRHGTIIPALLITPKRIPLLGAKLITLTSGALVLGLVAFGGATAIVLPVLSARHITSELDVASVAGIIAGGSIVTVLAAAFGVGIGAIMRNQVGAVVTVLGFLYVLEPLVSLVPGVGRAVQRFGFGGLASGASGTTGFSSSTRLLGQAPAVLVLAAYACVVLIGGATLPRRRDLR